MAATWRRAWPIAIVAIGLACLGLLPGVHSAHKALASQGPSKVTNRWLTPADQPALNAAASQVSAAAGRKYFTYVTVDTNRNIVNVYLAHAPGAVIDQLRALHPGRYVFHNSAAHPESALLKLQAAINVSAWAAAGVHITTLAPTRYGYLMIGVRSRLAVAALRLYAAYGRNWIHVVRDPYPPVLLTQRYSDVSAWNGGDFIYHQNSTQASNCTSGIPVHNVTTGTQYMLTASHCFWVYANNGVGTTVHNGYVEDDFSIYPNSSKTLIGNVTTDSDISANTTSLDVALIQVASSTVDFDAAWNSTGRAVQIGTSNNDTGDQVCTSGAFDGQVCGLVIQQVDAKKCVDDGCGTFCVDHLAEAESNTSGVVAAGTGDSGGPVYSYSGSNLLANGMIDIGNAQVSCTSKPPGTSTQHTCYHIVYYVEMPHINSNWNVAPNS